MSLLTLFAGFMLGASALMIIRGAFENNSDGDKYEALLQPLMSPPQLPPSSEAGPYRKSDEGITVVQPTIQLPASISFQDFIDYWRVVGLPDNPAEDQDFIGLAMRLRMCSARGLSRWLAKEVSSRLENDENECRFIAEQTFAQIFIQAMAVRNSSRDGQIISKSFKYAKWSESRYVQVLALAKIWPVNAATLAKMSEMTEWRRSKDSSGTKLINQAAKRAMAKWKRDDPQRFMAISQKIL